MPSYKLNVMDVKELITKLLRMQMNEEVFINTENGLKKIRCVVPVESDTVPRYYVEIITE